MPSPPTPLPANATALFDLATAARRFIEPIWMGWHRAWGGDPPAVSSQWTCGRTSLFLVRILSTRGFEARWVSGTPRTAPGEPEIGPYGYLCDGIWQSHAWAECGDYIVDITADQFGAPPVLVVDRGDRRYCKGERDTALPEFVAARQRAVDDIWTGWLRLQPGSDETPPTALVPPLAAAMEDR